MDIVSITGFILTGCVKAGCKIKDFIKETNTVEETILGLDQDVTDLGAVVKVLQSTLDQKAITESAQSSGFIGSLWSHMRTSLSDANAMLYNVQNAVETVSMSVSLLDAQRKVLRIRSASKEFMRYRERIQSFHNVINVSMSSVTV